MSNPVPQPGQPYPQGQPPYPQAQPPYPQPQYPQAQPQYPSAQPQYQQSQPQYPSAQPQYQQSQPEYPQAQPQYPQGQPGQSPYSPEQPYQTGPPGPDGQPAYPLYPGSGAPPAEKKKGVLGKTALRVGAALVVLLVVFLAKSFLFGDKAKDAKAGDCIAADKAVATDGTTKTGATVVDCGSADAKFTVIARVDGKTDAQGPDCDKYFKQGDEGYVYSSTAGQGYLLCLKPKV